MLAGMSFKISITIKFVDVDNNKRLPHFALCYSKPLSPKQPTNVHQVNFSAII